MGSASRAMNKAKFGTDPHWAEDAWYRKNGADLNADWNQHVAQQKAAGIKVSPTQVAGGPSSRKIKVAGREY